MKIIIIGSKGLLGGALIRHCQSLKMVESVDFLALDLPDFDVTSKRFALETICEFEPTHILNGAGINLIDWLEKKPNTARTVHVQGTANMREAAKRCNAFLVQFSCAEVYGQTADVSTMDGNDGDNIEIEAFGGKQFGIITDEPDAASDTVPSNVTSDATKGELKTYQPFFETDQPEPVSVYAKTKLDSERAACETPRHLVIRTGPLFGRTGEQSSGNVVETLLNSLRRSEKMSVINDIDSSYTWGDDLARATFALIERNASGLYHVVNSGAATPLDVAQEIVKFTGVRREFQGIAANDYALDAPRAAYTVLDATKYHALKNIPPMPSWQDALATYIESRSVILHR